MTLSRRELIGSGVAAAAATGIARAEQTSAERGQSLPLAFDATDPNLKFDLLIAGGTVVECQRQADRKSIRLNSSHT